MNNILNTLKKHGLEQDELPKVIINKIAHLEEIQSDLAETNDELKTETDEQMRKEMRATIVKAENYIEDLQENIVAMIEDYAEEKESGAGSEPIRREPIRREPIRRTENNVRPYTLNGTPLQPTANNLPTKKKSNALAWIFGGVVLVLTLGAVNTMSKQ
jgi:hypothetical protein